MVFIIIRCTEEANYVLDIVRQARIYQKPLPALQLIFNKLKYIFE